MEKEFQNKTIILGVPNHFGLPEKFKENLEFLGFRVYLLGLEGKFTMNLKDHTIHLFKKITKKDKTHKAKIKSQFFEQIHLEFLSTLPEKIDYCLIIRPDLYSEKLIEKITHKVNLSAAYQWDGMDRFPRAKNYIHLFHRFFVFDIRDALSYPECMHITNFYFDDDMQKTTIDTDVFFIGTYMQNRIEQIVKLSCFFNENKLITKLFLQVKRLSKVKKYQKYGLIFIKKPMKFRENLQFLKRSFAVLDFKNDIHNGLSFRTFEAVGFEKKLITNNSLVKDYNFYNKNNIFLLQDRSLEELKEFLSKPYEKIPENIRIEYSFSSWIKKVLHHN